MYVTSLQCRHHSCYWLLKYSCYIPSLRLTLAPFSSGFRRFQVVQNGIKTSELSEHESGQVKIGINKRKKIPDWPSSNSLSILEILEYETLRNTNLKHELHETFTTQRSKTRSIGLSLCHVLKSGGLSACTVLFTRDATRSDFCHSGECWMFHESDCRKLSNR